MYKRTLQTPEDFRPVLEEYTTKQGWPQGGAMSSIGTFGEPVSYPCVIVFVESQPAWLFVYPIEFQMKAIQSPEPGPFAEKRIGRPDDICGGGYCGPA